ncbi:3-hydroxyacyl-CoA dehydrogenase NAD-binding domain-containing protein [Mycolicibacterium sp. CBMA 226]|uniref:3-hydroxyacyl-CoA dehydrogenase NAD-binding domain-containing protein n=1 Tax=Mycolicibacterium sp. CBMA 226 TaxID=2606611 RepID=UPI0012DE5ABC|nr:3-hydroxyacyl-CoA dehydrogenase NAD-binding domain-containing protein [Mycolicibacterium sp. CBMA 226]MUL74509.1 3-hydroxyacyl-CoA dehydrogenase [Mycolicibacterium sp. CBMA 226]
MTRPNTILYSRSDDGVVTLVLDDPDKSANTMTTEYQDSMDAALDRLEAEKDQVVGVILTSAKKTFFAGGDLNRLRATGPDDAEESTRRATRIKRQLRRLERFGRPVVAAINGTALGGGAEITLACHHRIVLDDPAIRLGFPEVTLGLLPGAGGVVRSTRLLGIRSALENLLLKGQQIDVREALKIGLVHELATDLADLMAKSLTYIKEHPDACAPWDVKGFKIPGGDATDPKLSAYITALPAVLRKNSKGAPAPAPHHIVCAAVDGARVDFDTAQKIETRYFVDLATGQISTNMIQGRFFDMQAIAKGASRPDGYERTTFQKVGVVGAGMMGAGIAYACAKAGIDAVLKDVSPEAAERGKAYSVQLTDKAVARGAMTGDAAAALLDRIQISSDAADLGSCDLVIEAVFEDPALKAKVFGEVDAIVTDETLIASNTSSLPITGLAEGVSRPADFIGLHFFSPVDKMQLLEVIRGEQTSDATLARALDFARQIRKTPIVVNDSRGFFTSRVFGSFTREGVSLLADGVAPSSIEQATGQAGYPVPVLQLVDEVSLTLSRKVREEYKRAALESGNKWTPHPSEPVIDRMVNEFGRGGRAAGAGFYDYVDGKRVGLWSGLAEHFGGGSGSAIPLQDMIDRMLFAQALEAIKCIDEGVITTAAEANVGSLLGIGFPGWTGGVIQYINGYPGGTTAFVARAKELADWYGERFVPSDSLRAKAETGEKIK